MAQEKPPGAQFVFRRECFKLASIVVLRLIWYDEELQ